MDNLRPELRDLMCVQRWSIVPMFRRQSTAEHSFYVAIYAIELYELALEKPPGPEFIKWALLHDADEIHSGDIPTPFKRKMGIQSKNPPNLDPLDILIVRIADILEAYLFLLEERRLGNYKARELEDQLYNRLFTECAKITFEDIKTKISQFIADIIYRYQNYAGRVE